MSTDEIVHVKRNKLKDKYKSWYCLDVYNTTPPKCFKTIQVQHVKKTKSVATDMSKTRFLNFKEDSQTVSLVKAIFNIFVFFCTVTTVLYRPLIYLLKLFIVGRNSSLKRFLQPKF